mgnify:CR=1 FL=1
MHSKKENNTKNNVPFTNGCDGRCRGNVVEWVKCKSTDTFSQNGSKKVVCYNETFNDNIFQNKL